MSTAWEINSGPVLLARLRRRVEDLEEEVERRRRSGEELGRRRSEVDRLSKLVWGQVQGHGVRCSGVECSILKFKIKWKFLAIFSELHFFQKNISQ